MLQPGWSKDRLASSPIDVVEAARWKLFVESVWPFDLVDSLNVAELPKGAKEAEGARVRARMAGRKHLQELRKIIYPDDEPPDA